MASASATPLSWGKFLSAATRKTSNRLAEPLRPTAFGLERAKCRLDEYCRRMKCSDAGEIRLPLMQRDMSGNRIGLRHMFTRSARYKDIKVKWLRGVFSQTWNRASGRQGHVFQGRYNSVPVNGSAADPINLQANFRNVISWKWFLLSITTYP